MKLKIKIKLLEGSSPVSIIDKGDWIDLRCNEDIILNAPEVKIKKVEKDRIKYISYNTALVKLGVAMQLPKGFEAWIVPRSSTPKMGIELRNSIGIIDNSYCGDNDEWKFGAVATEDTKINKGTRIAQFRIMLSQKATFFQKIKWLFSDGIKIEFVDSLGNKDRGGIGSTGKQ